VDGCKAAMKFCIAYLPDCDWIRKSFVSYGRFHLRVILTRVILGCAKRVTARRVAFRWLNQQSLAPFPTFVCKLPLFTVSQGIERGT
jgi:hypothetical protein